MKEKFTFTDRCNNHALITKQQQQDCFVLARKSPKMLPIQLLGKDTRVCVDRPAQARVFKAQPYSMNLLWEQHPVHRHVGDARGAFATCQPQLGGEDGSREQTRRGQNILDRGTCTGPCAGAVWHLGGCSGLNCVPSQYSVWGPSP